MSFLNNPDIQDDGQGNVTIQKPDGTAANLNVKGNTNLNGKTKINSAMDNLPLEVIGKDGQFWFYSKDEKSNGAIIRALQNQFGLIFTGNDRIRIEGAPGDNRAAVLGDLSNMLTSGGSSDTGYWYSFGSSLMIQTRLLTSVPSGSYMYVDYPKPFPNACIGASAFLGNINNAFFVTGVSPNLSNSSLLVNFNQIVTAPNAAILNIIAIGF